MNNKEITKMTIFYRKFVNNKIDKVVGGESTLKTYAHLNIAESEALYGMLVVSYDSFIYNNFEYYEVVEKDGNMTLQMKQSFKEQLKQFI